MARVSLSGRIRVPVLTLHGTLDTLLPISLDSDRYAAMVDAAAGGDAFRYYRIVEGNHVDGLYGALPAVARPMLPCYRAAFDAMVGWVERGAAPPASGTVAWDRSTDEVNACSL